MAPFLVSFPFSLAPSLLIFSYVTHGSPPVCFSFYILFSFNFFPLFLFFCIFSFPSLLSFFGAPFLSLFFSPFPCFFLFRPSFLAPLLDPPGVQAHAMHPPGYATEFKHVTFHSYTVKQCSLRFPPIYSTHTGCRHVTTAVIFCQLPYSHNYFTFYVSNTE